MKVGITLPQFQDDAELALEVARLAEAAGLDGVFVFDHLWPIGRPDRPALHGPTLLAALAAETGRVAVGTLVARVGLVPDAVLVHQFATVQRIAGDRLVAGLGIGDQLSRPENEAYGVPFAPVEERRAALTRVCRSLRGIGVTTWIGGKSKVTTAIAQMEADAVNRWQSRAEEVAGEVARGTEVTWGGQIDLAGGEETDVARLLRELARAGASWAVLAPVTGDWQAALRTIVGATTNYAR